MIEKVLKILSFSYKVLVLLTALTIGIFLTKLFFPIITFVLFFLYPLRLFKTFLILLSFLAYQAWIVFFGSVLVFSVGLSVQMPIGIFGILLISPCFVNHYLTFLMVDLLSFCWEKIYSYEKIE